jgi:hypothetical protein
MVGEPEIHKAFTGFAGRFREGFDETAILPGILYVPNEIITRQDAVQNTV